MNSAYVKVTIHPKKKKKSAPDSITTGPDEKVARELSHQKIAAEFIKLF